MDAGGNTLLLVIVVIASVSALAWGAIGHAMRMAPRAATRLCLANLLIVAGTVLLTGRARYPDFLHYQVSDWLVLAGVTLFREGILFLVRLEAPSRLTRWGPLLIAVLITAPLSYEPASIRTMAMAFSGVTAWLGLTSFVECYRGLSADRLPMRARLAVSWPFLVTGLIMLYRSIAVSTELQTSVELASGPQAGDGPFLWMMVVLLLVLNQSLAGLAVGRLIIRVRELAEHDYLTGCLNRRSLESRLAIEFERTRRFGGVLAVMMFDLDHFKHINDTRGHAAGDAAIQHAAQVAGKAIRTLDALGRYGGEEFMVLMPGTDLEGARQAAQRIRQALHDQDLVWQGEHIAVRASFGVAVLHGDESTDALVRRADAAMYTAKHQGRDRVEIGPVPTSA